MFLDALSLGGDAPNWWQASVRALLVYFVALVLVRVGEKRALGKNTALDVVIAVMLGSVVSRGINSSSVSAAVFGGGVLVLLHWLLSVVTFRSDWLGTVLKGSPRVLVRDGTVDWDAMRRSHISEDDLLSALRREARLDSVEDVRVARLERSGDISVLKKDSGSGPRTVTIDVKDGVQTVRLLID